MVKVDDWFEKLSKIGYKPRPSGDCSYNFATTTARLAVIIEVEPLTSLTYCILFKLLQFFYIKVNLTGKQSRRNGDYMFTNTH